MYLQAVQISKWNRQVLAALPPIPEEIKEISGELYLYLEGRKRIFLDFAIAAEKVGAAIVKSGCILLFQLKTEVQQLRNVTLHEVRELHDLLVKLVQKKPEIKRNFQELICILEGIQRSQNHFYPKGN